ncbi:MAG: hypothetical protein PHV30_02240 [Candidatus Margulisbacteria bacterium]|nr:hypothetical protein [Candidatus Margulisiibacteriota bacterium]
MKTKLISNVIEKQTYNNVGADCFYATAVRASYFGKYSAEFNDTEKRLFEEMGLSERDRKIAKNLFYDDQGNALDRDYLGHISMIFQDLYREYKPEIFMQLSAIRIIIEVQDRLEDYLGRL